jgi:uncharacterized short protein YbdD (DUF466 family)
MAAADKNNRLVKVEPIAKENVKAFPAFGENFGLRIAMAGAMPGGWSSDHRSETDKFSGWHYIAIHAIYKQIIQATVEVYEHRLTVPNINKPPQPAPGTPPGMPPGMPPEQQQFPGAAPPPGNFTKGMNEQADNMVPMPSYDPFLKKLKKPNPNQTLGSFNGERAMQLCLTGRVLIWNVRSILTGSIIERYVIPTCLASPRPPSKELPRGGWYVLPEGARYAEEAGYYMVGSLEAAFGKTIPAEDIQIIKFPHPRFKDDGQSPVSAGALWTDTSEMVDRSRHNHLKQGPDPSVVIGLDGDVDEMSIRRAEAAFNDRYAGPENHGRAMFVTPTKTVQPLTTAPKDMSYESGFEQLRDAQLALHGVPLAAVGLSSPSGREGLYAPLLQFIELSVQPLLTLLGEEDSALFNTGREHDIQIVYSAKKFNDEDLLEKQIQTDISAGVLTKGELRKLRGRELFGDERDEEMCGASGGAPPGMPGMPGMPPGFPPGQVPGAPNQEEPPAGQPTVSNPEQQAPGQMQMPMGRAMSSNKPRLAAQIAKALAKQLEAYGILKGGPGSGNHGHSGRPGQVGGSAPDDGGGGGAAGTSPSSSSRPRAAANPASGSLDESTRRILSRAAWSARNGIGGQEDFQTAIRDVMTPSPYSQAPSREQAEAYYRHENELLTSYRTHSTVGGRNQYARERAKETDNFATISHGESRRILSGMSANGEQGWKIATAIANTGDAELLARGLASFGMDKDAIEQAVNLNNALHAGQANAKEVARSAIEHVSDASQAVGAKSTLEDLISDFTTGSAHNRLNDISDVADPFAEARAQAAVEPPVRGRVNPFDRDAVTANAIDRTETVTSESGIERKIGPREAPEAIDGTDVKETKLIKDIKERASKIKVTDEEPIGDFDEDEARDNAERDWEGSSEQSSAVQEELERGAENLRHFTAIPDSLPSSVGQMLEDYYADLGDRIGDGDINKMSPDTLVEETEWFFRNKKDEIENQLIIASNGDGEKLKQLQEEFSDWKDTSIQEARGQASNVSDAVYEHYREYESVYIDQAQVDHASQGGDNIPDEMTWQRGSFKFKTTSGSGYEIQMSESTRPLTAKQKQESGRDSITGYDLIFTDASGSVSITGENTEAKKKSGRSDELEVFRTVSSSVLGFIQNKDADVLTFTAIEEKRQKLYDKLTQTIARIDGKYVAVSTGGGRRAAHYYVVKRELKPYVEQMIREKAGSADLKIDWLVKRFPGGYVKSSKHGWVQVRDFHFKGGPGSGNFGHAGRPGEVGGSAPDDGGGGGMAGTSPSEKKEKKPAATGKTKKPAGSKVPKAEKEPKAKKEKAPKAEKEKIWPKDLENPRVMQVHPDAKKTHSRTSAIQIDTKDIDKKKIDFSPTHDLAKWNKENGYARKGVGSNIDLVDYAKELDKNYGGPPRPLLDEKGNIDVENVEYAARSIADFAQEAKRRDPSWPLWYGEIEDITVDLSEEEGKFNFSPKSRELLQTESGGKMFVSILAMTSQEGTPDENLRSTKNLYDFYTANGRLPSQAEAEKLVVGKAAKDVAGNMVKYAKIVDHFKGDVAKAFDFLNEPIQAGQLQAVMTKIGVECSSADAFSNQYVPKSYVFGPKIGAFHANLGGMPDLLTQDRWLTRTIGRVTGQIGFTEEQIVSTWTEALNSKDAPTAEHVRIAGMSALSIKAAVKKCAEGGELTDAEYKGLNRLAQAHVSSSPKKKAENRVITRNDFTTKLNTAMKKITTVVDTPGSSMSRHVNQLVAETASKILTQRGEPMTVREVQAAIWMLEKKMWYEAGVGNKRGGENSYKMALENLRKNGEPSVEEQKKRDRESANDDE